MSRTLPSLLLLLVVIPACGGSSDDPCEGKASCIGVPTGASTKTVEEAFALVTEGGTIAFGEGSFAMQKTLNLAAASVTVRGAGIDKTTLDFGGQTVGEDGILVTGDHFTIQDLRVLDAKGNGIKVTGTRDRLVKGVTFQRVAGEWTAAASAQNGKYAIYPVLAEDVLMEDCVAKGSSDAGIYVGQAKNVIVRRNKGSGNVAGLEIENTIGADVYENELDGNAGGLLVFGLPDLIQNTSKVRVFNNIARNNDLGNFAAGGVVQQIPTGSGIIVMASSEVELFGNMVTGNDTTGIVVVSYCIVDTPYCDDPANASKVLDPFPRKVYVHDNTFMGNGDKAGEHLTNATGGISELAVVLSTTFGTTVPDILYDGIFAPPKGQDPATWVPANATNPMELCIKGNGAATFSNVDAGTYDGSFKFPHANDPANRMVGAFDCTLALGLSPIQIAGVTPSPN